jgi:5,10-methenyltetrahydrofolate synthetase
MTHCATWHSIGLVIDTTSSDPDTEGGSSHGSEAFATADYARRDQERKRLLAKRIELSESVRVEKDARIADHLRILLRDVLRGSRPPWKIGGYWPIRNEPDLRPLFHELTKGGHRIGLPLVDRVMRPLTFVHWKPHSAMAPSFLGVPVPTSGNAVYVELLLLPCVGFSIGPDGVRHRLGYGGGYYDRTLNSRRFKAIGVAYEAMRLEHFEPAPHDMPLDYIVTEEGVR